MSANGLNRPGTTINWIDQSETSNVIEETIVRPLFLQLFTSDKGPELLHTVHGNDFFKLYGSKPSFEKHGQPLIQAAEIIKAGGEVLCKRVVADDAALANLVIVAKVNSELVQKVNSAGKPLYIDATTGKETTDNNGGLNERAMMNTAKVKYEAISIKDAKSMNYVKTLASTKIKDEVEVEYLTSYEYTTKVGDPLTDENPVGQINDTEDPDFGKYVYPLFVVVDNGRGVSSKRFKITPDYTVSKGLDFQLYKLNFVGDTAQENEYVWFTLNDDIIYLGENRSLGMAGKDMIQIKASSIDDSIQMYLNRLSAITGMSLDELKASDVLFGCNRKGERIPQITIDAEGFELEKDMTLQEGSNGSFGDMPIAAPSYGAEMLKVINGEYDDSIFNRDRFMIDVCCDANYPAEVKQGLYELAVYREDFLYLRDYGTNVTTYEFIKDSSYQLDKSKFVCDYFQAWDVIDSWTKKQITVTAPFSMATKLIPHLLNRRSAPACGILYDFTFPNVIEGTITFLPKITPHVDQKTLLNDIGVNYASYINGVLTMETAFTTEEKRTQLKYMNNILAVTKVIHNIRTECPKLRYSFITDTDLEQYREDVNKVIQRSKNDFLSITMEYTQDEIMAANKIFEADIFVRFKNFVQEEIFNIYTLS